MITALILMHLFGGGGGSIEIFSRSDFRTIGRSIEEPARAEAATQAMERVNEVVASLLKQRDQSFRLLSEINTKVDSPDDAYDKVIDELWQARREARSRFVEEVFIMRKNMTRDEWDTAFGNSEQ